MHSFIFVLFNFFLSLGIDWFLLTLAKQGLHCRSIQLLILSWCHFSTCIQMQQTKKNVFITVKCILNWPSSLVKNTRDWGNLLVFQYLHFLTVTGTCVYEWLLMTTTLKLCVYCEFVCVVCAPSINQPKGYINLWLHKFLNGLMFCTSTLFFFHSFYKSGLKSAHHFTQAMLALCHPIFFFVISYHDLN